jgi:hypothetical protein
MLGGFIEKLVLCILLCQWWYEFESHAISYQFGKLSTRLWPVSMILSSDCKAWILLCTVRWQAVSYGPWVLRCKFLPCLILSRMALRQFTVQRVRSVV